MLKINKIRIIVCAIVSLFMLTFCSNETRFSDIDVYKDYCLKNDSVFNFFIEDIDTDSVFINRYITTDSRRDSLPSTFKNYEHLDLMRKYQIYEILRTEYSIEFRLNDMLTKPTYYVRLVYRTTDIDDRITDKILIEKIGKNKYIVAETYW